MLGYLKGDPGNPLGKALIFLKLDVESGSYRDAKTGEVYPLRFVLRSASDAKEISDFYSEHAEHKVEGLEEAYRKGVANIADSMRESSDYDLMEKGIHEKVIEAIRRGEDPGKIFGGIIISLFPNYDVLRADSFPGDVIRLNDSSDPIIADKRLSTAANLYILSFVEAHSDKAEPDAAPDSRKMAEMGPEEARGILGQLFSRLYGAVEMGSDPSPSADALRVFAEGTPISSDITRICDTALGNKPNKIMEMGIRFRITDAALQEDYETAAVLKRELDGL